MIFQNFVRAFLKAAGHRYYKRVPYMTPKGKRYRYFYRVTSTHRGRHAFDEAHLVEGTKFALHGEGESEFHGHITKVDGDQVTYVIDDGPRKGEEVTTSRKELVAELNDVHGVQDKLTAERAKVKAAIAEAKRAGHAGVVRRLERRLRALGGEPEAESVEPAERGAENVGGLSDEEVKEMDDAVDRFRFTPEEIQNMSLDELKETYETMWKVVYAHRNKSSKTPEYQRLHEAIEGARAIANADRDLPRTDVHAAEDALSAFEERYTERYVTPLRSLIKPIDERLTRLQRNKRARERRAEKKQRTQAQAERQARREERERKKREEQARIDEATARRMLTQDEAREMQGLARRYSEAQPAEPTESVEPTEREAENVGADVSSEVSAVRDAIAGALNASERVTRGEMLKESELQFGRPRAEYTLANRLRDLIDALPDGDDELSALRTEYIRSARKRTADAKAVFEKIEARLAQINATDESSEAKDTRVDELRSEFERKLSIRDPDPSLYVKLFNEAGYMDTLRDVPLNELLDHPHVKEFFDLADTVNDRVDMYTAIPDLPAEFANRLFEAFAQRYKERGKDDLGLSSPVLEGIIYGQNYHSEQGKEERARKEEAFKRKYTEPEAQSFDVLGISSSDLDTSDVVGSYRNISHDREARGYEELREWIDALQGIEQQAQNAIDAGADETRTREQFSRYAKKLLDAKRKVISARAQTASSAITGAGSFNKRQQEKRRQRLDSLEAAYRRLLNQTPEAPTTEGAESPIQTKVKHLINVLNAGDEVDEITSTGRRSRSSSNVDKKLIGFVKQILAEEFEGMESPAFTPVGDRTPLQTAYAKLKGSLNKLEGEQRLRRGSRQSAEDLRDARRVSRARLREALNDLRQAKQE